jgi:AbrB family looped-hinge helix DNA binding protein
MTVQATVTSKGQITIPAEVRKRLGLRQGDRVEFVMEGATMTIRPVRQEGNPFDAYVGALGTFADAAEVNAWLRDLRDEN